MVTDFLEPFGLMSALVNVWGADYIERSLRKWSSDGFFKWSYSVNQINRWSVECDRFGFVYYGTDDGFVHKLTPNGSVVWVANLSANGRVWRLSVDDQQFVYTTHQNGQTCKLNPSGTVVWTYTYSPVRAGSALAIDADKNVYIASRTDDDADQILKLVQNAAGTSVTVGWTIFNIDNCEFLAVSPSNLFVYAVSKGTTKFVMKINTSTGATVWSVVPNASVQNYGVAVGLNEFVYVATSGGYLYKLNPQTGATVWSTRPETGFLLAVAIDAYGTLYAAGSAGLYILTENSDGTSVSLTRTLTPANNQHICAVEPGVYSRTFQSMPPSGASTLPTLSFSRFNRALRRSAQQQISFSQLRTAFPFSATEQLSIGRTVGRTAFQSGPVECIGVDGVPFSAYMDFGNDGGYWLLVAKYGAANKDYDVLFSERAVDTAGAAATSLLTGDFGGYSTYARLSRANMNALWKRSEYVIRVHFKSDVAEWTHVSGVYFQRKITNPTTFDFWNGLYNAGAWSDGSTTGSLATHGGTRWEASFAWANLNPTLGNYTSLTMGGMSNVYNKTTHTVTFNGTPYQATGADGYRMGAWDYPVTVSDGVLNTSMIVTRHMGVFGDITSGNQWILTSNPSNGNYAASEVRQSMVFLKMKPYCGIAAPLAARSVADLVASGATVDGVYWMKPENVVHPYRAIVNFTTQTETAFTRYDGSTAALAAPSYAYLRAHGITTSGVYWIKPSGWSGAAFQVYIDFDTDGGGWVIVAKYGGHAKTLDKLFNTSSYDTGTNSLLNAQFSGLSTYARLSRTQMNHLWRTSHGYVIRTHFKNDDATATSGVYFQRKITNLAAFDLWNGLGNSVLWADGATVTQSTFPMVSYGGVRWEASFAWANTNPLPSTYTTSVVNSAFYNAQTHAITFNGVYAQPTDANGYRMGAWDYPVAVTAPPNNLAINISRHMGLFADITSGNQWILTSNTADSRFNANENRQSIVFLRWA